MAKATKTIVALILLVLVITVAIGVYFAGRWLISLFGELDRQVAIVTGIGAVTILIAAIIARGRSSSSESVSRMDAMLSRKSEVYENLLRTVLKTTESRGDESRDDDDQTELKALQPQLLLFASPGVIRLYTEIVDHSMRGEPDYLDTSMLQKLIQEMRKDLGLSNLGLQTATVAAPNKMTLDEISLTRESDS